MSDQNNQKGNTKTKQKQFLTYRRVQLHKRIHVAYHDCNDISEHTKLTKIDHTHANKLTYLYIYIYVMACLNELACPTEQLGNIVYLRVVVFSHTLSQARQLR